MVICRRRFRSCWGPPSSASSRFPYDRIRIALDHSKSVKPGVNRFRILPARARRSPGDRLLLLRLVKIDGEMETSGFTPSGKIGPEFGKMSCATATAARHRRPAHRRLGEFDLLSVASYPTIMAPDTMLFPQSSVSLSGTPHLLCDVIAESPPAARPNRRMLCRVRGSSNAKPVDS
jgi:hypothetical protein